MKQCPQCHHPNPDRARFCAGCGAELIRQCDTCNRPTPADARFCPYCGTPILSAPPVPWLERRVTPQVRQTLYTLSRWLGITLLIMAFVTAFLTPPPRIFDDVVLLVLGAALMVVAEALKSGRKPKPPGGNPPEIPDPPAPGGYEIIPEDESLEAEADGLHDGRRIPPPGSTQGPYLN